MTGIFTIYRGAMALAAVAALSMASPARADLRLVVNVGSSQVTYNSLTSGQTVVGSFGGFNYSITVSSDNSTPGTSTPYVDANVNYLTNTNGTKSAVTIQYTATGFTYPGNLNLESTLTSATPFPPNDKVTGFSEVIHSSTSSSTGSIALLGPGAMPNPGTVAYTYPPGSVSTSKNVGSYPTPYSVLGDNVDLLGPGDTISYNSLSEITPEPAALLMGCIGLPIGGLLVWRFRRRSLRAQPTNA